MNRLHHEKRAFAYVIDLTIALIIALMVKIFVPFTFTNGYMKWMSSFNVILYFVYFVYLIIIYTITGGRSVGRLIFGSHIVSKDGSKMSFGTIVVRSMMQALIPLAFFNAFYMLVNRTQESIYDLATDTVCVPKPPKEKFIKL